MSAEDNYYSALERLERDEPQLVDKGTQINNDTVAMESGRKRGSIKKQRYPQLCLAIDEAAKRQQAKSQAVAVSGDQKITRPDAADNAYREKYKALKRDYGIALQQNISLVYEVYTLRKKLVEKEKKSNVMDFPKS